VKTLQCREHGGTFEVIPRRGRPPVKCSPDNVCTRFNGNGKSARAPKPITQAERTANSKAIRKPRTKIPSNGLTDTGERMRQEYMSKLASAEGAPEMRATKTPESHANGRSPISASLAKAKEAKGLLEAQGWICDGKGKGNLATITASRGEETLFLSFRDGELVDQNYMLWNVDKPAANNMPANKLTFDTDEMTDSELIKALSGMKVVWWNKLASNTEVGVIGTSKIVIEHSYAGNGDETPADRIIKFVDYTRQGDGISGRMRAFRLGALIKVG
jgi:hypothetical protein